MPKKKTKSSPRSYKVNSLLVVNARHEKGMSQEDLARVTQLSPNTILNAEKGKPVAIKTIKRLCDKLELDFQLIIGRDGFKIEPTAELKPVGRGLEDVKIVIDDLHGKSDLSDLVNRIQLMLNCLDEEEAKIVKAHLGSVHLTMQLSEEAAKRLHSLCNTNDDGELVLDDRALCSLVSKLANEKRFLEWELDKAKEELGQVESNPWPEHPFEGPLSKRTDNANYLKAQRSWLYCDFLEIASPEDEGLGSRRQAVLQVARELYATRPDWVTFFREILGVEGVARSVFGGLDEYLKFEQSKEFEEIQILVANLRSEKGSRKAELHEPTNQSMGLVVIPGTKWVKVIDFQTHPDFEFVEADPFYLSRKEPVNRLQDDLSTPSPSVEHEIG